MLNLKCSGNADPNGPLDRQIAVESSPDFPARGNVEIDDPPRDNVQPCHWMVSPVTGSPFFESLVMNLSPLDEQFIVANEDKDKQLLVMGNHVLRMLTLVQSVLDVTLISHYAEPVCSYAPMFTVLVVLIKSTDFLTGADAVDANAGYSAEAGPGLLMLQYCCNILKI